MPAATRRWPGRPGSPAARRRTGRSSARRWWCSKASTRRRSRRARQCRRGCEGERRSVGLVRQDGLRLRLSRPRHRAGEPDPCRDAARSGRRVRQRARGPRAGRRGGGIPQARISGRVRQCARSRLWLSRHPPDALDRRAAAAHGRRGARRTRFADAVARTAWPIELHDRAEGYCGSRSPRTTCTTCRSAA